MAASARIGVLLVAGLIVLSGCQGLIINSQARLIRDAAPAAQAHWDWELVGKGIPYSILQLEGLIHLSPENEILLERLAQTYVSYAYGWIEDEIERTSPLEFEQIEHLQRRARHMYLRARRYAFRRVTVDHDDFPLARSYTLEDFKAYLAREFDDEDDAAGLFWSGFSWGSAINITRDDPVMVADLGYARALVERSRELDPTFFNAAATTFLAVVNSSLSPAMGGDPQMGRRLFEEALERTERKLLLVQYNYARTFAVQTQDRELFEQLLNEVIAAPDLGNETRLQNKIAKRRARRLLGQADELFF